MKTFSKLASVAVTAAAVTAGSAATASAYQIYPSESATTPLADGTTWEAESGAVRLQNSAGSTIVTCPSSRVSGVVDNDSAALRVTAGGFVNASGQPTCAGGGAPMFVSFDSGWSISAISGAAPIFTGAATRVSMTWRCGTPTAAPATYSGTLGSDTTVSFALRNTGTGTEIDLNKSGTLTRFGYGCPILPNPARLSVRWKATSVNGAPVSPTNNLWFK